MQIIQRKMGWIEVITGSMFSGKTEELIRRVRRAQIAKQAVQIFKPAIDDRYGAEHVTSHNSEKLLAENVRNSSELLEKVRDDTQVVAIDECQFFDEKIVSVCERLANKGKRIIAAGLDQDYLGRPFGPVPHLLAVAEFVTKNSAICVVCGNPASKTQRIVDEEGRIRVGAAEAYEARCRVCFEPGGPKQAKTNG
ncbi:MAG: thymidine kinase [Deltaproteobacteria bacterium]|nr:thymidine kinase [Deltaproteobacteria bacterium]